MTDPLKVRLFFYRVIACLDSYKSAVTLQVSVVLAARNHYPYNYIKINCCSLVSLKHENNWTDLAYFGFELFMEVQGKFKYNHTYVTLQTNHYVSHTLALSKKYRSFIRLSRYQQMRFWLQESLFLRKYLN